MPRLSRATGPRPRATCDSCRQPIRADDSAVTVKLDKHEAMRRATPYAQHHLACWTAAKRA